MSPAPLLSLAAAFGFGLAAVLMRRALQHARPLVAAVVSVSFTTVFLWALVASTMSPRALATPRVLPFLLAGLLAPGLGRLFFFTGVGRVGAARAASLGASGPLFAVGLAVLVFGERPGWGLLAGAVAIVAGAVLLSYRPQGETSWRRRDLMLPLLAALSFALRDNISRWGLQRFPDVLAAATAAASTSAVLMWMVLAVRPGGSLAVGRLGLGYLALAGVAEGLAYLSMWRALAMADVSVVSPLVNAYPIFTVALAALLLRDLERVTWRIVLAALLVVAGIVAVVRFGG